MNVITTTVGGSVDQHFPDSTVLVQAEGVRLRALYRPVPRGRVYRVVVPAQCLGAVIAPTGKGFIATCPQLKTLGYGAGLQAALGDLTEATREYLSFLAEDKPRLAPRIAHHARYLPLLRFPEGSWFATIVLAPPEIP